MRDPIDLKSAQRNLFYDFKQIENRTHDRNRNETNCFSQKVGSRQNSQDFGAGNGPHHPGLEVVENQILNLGK